MCLICSSNRGDPKSWVKSSVGCSFANSPLHFHLGFIVLAGDQGGLSPAPFHISAAELNVSWHKLDLPSSFHLIAGDSSEVCQRLRETIAFYGKKCPQAEPLQAQICSIWEPASALVTQRCHFNPFLMHSVILGGVSSHPYFPSVHNLEVVLQCSPAPWAGIWKPQSKKIFSKHLRLSQLRKLRFLQSKKCFSLGTLVWNADGKGMYGSYVLQILLTQLKFPHWSGAKITAPFLLGNFTGSELAWETVNLTFQAP